MNCVNGATVNIIGRVANTKKTAKVLFIVLKHVHYTIQCVYKTTDTDLKLTDESIVKITGILKQVKNPIRSCSIEDFEISVNELKLVSASKAVLPLRISDASGSTAVSVSQETRLNNRWLDMRTEANNAIWKIKSLIARYFRQYLWGHNFTEINTPKIIPSASEGSGAEVFKLKYFGNDAYLAQSPQIYKQMTIMGDLEKIFEIGPVFRAENSNTHRHLCEFVGMDVEMEIKDHYHEVLDVAEGLFRYIFDNLSKSSLVEVVKKQHPSSKFAYNVPKDIIINIEENNPYHVEIKDNENPVLRMTYINAVKLLNTKINKKMNITEDLSTENEKILGKLVKEIYGVDFFIVDKFPANIRPFYTMECESDARFSNSFDIFMRGEEISSGAQRINCPEQLSSRLPENQKEHMKDYLESFKYGAMPHGGFGIGLERVLMLYLALPNIRMCSMYPRTPARISP